MAWTVLALRTTRVLAVVAAALGVALAGVPLFGVHGIESALVLGAVVPPLAALLGARIALAVRARREAFDVTDLAIESIRGALFLLALPVGVLALNALRVKNCAPLEGLVFIVLGPGAGVVLAALVGTAVGLVPFAPRLALVLAPTIVLSESVVTLVRIWATPAVFAYGHFFGYFPGSFYDELVPIPGALWNLRVVTCALVLACAAGLRAHFDPALRSLRLRPQPGRSALAVFAALGLAAGVLGEAFGAEFGLKTSDAYIAQALGGRVRSARCEFVVPREMPRARLERLAEDCDFRVTQIERWLGLHQTRPVRVLLFRSAEEKRALMGAATTSIAKPWRDEVYLQDRAWPHPVLGHEIAHVIAGHAAPGPFRLAGRLGGWWPDAALVEGVAVAAAWSDSSQGGLTPHQWARAAMEAGLAPTLDRLFGANFFAQQKGLAYTLAGSLLRWIADTEGSATVRRIYRTGNIAAALHRTLPEIDRAWRDYVVREPLPLAARALAEQRFSGGSILSTVCPHQVAARKEVLGQELAAGDDQAARASCRGILDMDPDDDAIRASLVTLLARANDAGFAAEYDRLRARGANEALVVATRHALADEAWRVGKPGAAAEYRALLDTPQGRDARRLLQVKALAAAGSSREARLLFDLLVGTPGTPTDGATAVYLARELRAERKDGLAQYLEARQLLNQGRFRETASLMADARTLGLPTEELRLEALRVEAMARFGAAEFDAATELWGRLWREGDPAQRVEAADWLARTRITRAR